MTQVPTNFLVPAADACIPAHIYLLVGGQFCRGADACPSRYHAGSQVWAGRWLSDTPPNAQSTNTYLRRLVVSASSRSLSSLYFPMRVPLPGFFVGSLAPSESGLTAPIWEERDMVYRKRSNTYTISGMSCRVS